MFGADEVKGDKFQTWTGTAPSKWQEKTADGFRYASAMQVAQALPKLSACPPLSMRPAVARCPSQRIGTRALHCRSPRQCLLPSPAPSRQFSH
jgi:hypothetical protein